MATTRPGRAPRSPLRPLGGFIHLLARFYQNYRAAIVRASHRKRSRGVDVDQQLSKDHTLWALHWGSVGKNKLHDPLGLIKPTARIAHLHDEEIARLEGPRGQKPHRTQHLVNLAFRLKVRLELELKVFVDVYTLKDIVESEAGAYLNKHGLLQFKVRAALNDSVGMLTEAHNAGGTTIISWEGYRGAGIPKDPAWHVTDYSRGRSHWI